MSIRVFLFSIFTVLNLMLPVGCASRPVYIEFQPEKSSLEQLQVVTKETLRQIRWSSENGREYKSPYFTRDQSPEIKPESAPERMYAHVLILGARRPYLVRVRVRTEVRNGREYSDGQDDKALGKRLAEELQKRLKNRDSKSNIFDDFKVF